MAEKREEGGVELAEAQSTPRCAECGSPMVDPTSIEIGVCLWCRPWSKETDDAYPYPPALYIQFASEHWNIRRWSSKPFSQAVAYFREERTPTVEVAALVKELRQLDEFYDTQLYADRSALEEAIGNKLSRAATLIEAQQATHDKLLEQSGQAHVWAEQLEDRLEAVEREKELDRTFYRPTAPVPRMNGTLVEKLLWRIGAIREALNNVRTSADNHALIAENALTVDDENAKRCAILPIDEER